MIESPLIDEIVSKATQKHLLTFLAGRFGSIPADVKKDMLAIEDNARLESLVEWAGACPDLASFRARLKSKKPSKRRRGT